MNVMLRVFVCGAHSTGKTTLINGIRSDPELPSHVVSEIARKIITENGWERRDFDPGTNPDVFYDLQMQILREQLRVDEELSAKNTSYLSDRGLLDPIIYCKMYLGDEWFREIVRTREAKECIKRHKAERSITVALFPNAHCIEDDNTRLTPRMGELLQFTELYQQFLRKNGISYKLIEELNLDSRISALKSLIQPLNG